MAAQTEALAKVDTLLKELWQLRDAFFASDAGRAAAHAATHHAAHPPPRQLGRPPRRGRA